MEQQQLTNKQKVGQFLEKTGKAAGQALHSVMNAGPQLINALLPNQPMEREDMSLPYAVNPFPMGTGSQAIYRKGGNVSLGTDEDMYNYIHGIPLSGAQPTYTTQERQQGGMRVTEQLPMNMPSMQPQIGPASMEYDIPKRITFEPLMDYQNNITAYNPVFPSSMNYWDAMDSFNFLPSQFGGVPVLNSKDSFKEANPNFRPYTGPYNWLPTFEDGGTLPEKEGYQNVTRKQGNIVVTEQVPIELMAKQTTEETPSTNYDSLSFSKAFAKARKELGNNQVFTWKGKAYTTQLAEETSKPSSNKAVAKAKPTPKKQETDWSRSADVESSPMYIANKDTYNPEYMRQFAPAFAGDKFNYVASQESNVYGHNRPAPKGLQKLAQDPEFNAWSEDVFMPAINTALAIEGGWALSSAMKQALKKSVKGMQSASARKLALENIKQAEDDLAKYNLQKVNEVTSSPIGKWANETGPYEWQSQSPIGQWASEPTYIPGSSPYQQILDMEHAWSPFQQAGLKVPPPTTKEILDMEHAYSPFKRAGLKVPQTKQEVLDMEHAYSPFKRAGLKIPTQEMGGFIEGQEYDLTQEQINRLIALGYEIE